MLQSLKNSSYYAQFTDKTSIWETRYVLLQIFHIILFSALSFSLSLSLCIYIYFFFRLADTEQYVQWMNEIQRKWIYLEPIFGRGSLPSEASRFNRVDVEFRIVLNGFLTSCHKYLLS